MKGIATCQLTIRNKVGTYIPNKVPNKVVKFADKIKFCNSYSPIIVLLKCNTTFTLE